MSLVMTVFLMPLADPAAIADVDSQITRIHWEVFTNYKLFTPEKAVGRILSMV
ncbi:hypothetical protein EVJ58_g3908 [Rhodofomes roseus]|uniref:Uncharacterized protein n=1 Tax=Rhodofomes roseus TaxID=34475 RepID=A0A4Y9YKX0_9APHY|nr:hypothetical protein EVJ58_g3908 [Rhodofomes roseus]